MPNAVEIIADKRTQPSQSGRQKCEISEVVVRILGLVVTIILLIAVCLAEW
ncbi:MAG TPA: hypothetical protein VKU82_13780 [Planctomycetaceae bacterium]|nr:hypothetical protein [Planctomycetaceae bacterium]